MKKIFGGAGLILTSLFFVMPALAADPADHLVVSQIQTTGGTGKTNNDFVEIYNPTDEDADLKGLRLVKRSKTGSTDTLLKSWTDTTIVKAHGYYLWANADFVDINPAADVKTSGTIADDNGVALRRGASDTGTIVEAVAWGAAANSFVEGQGFGQNPKAGQALERKPGGMDLGNGQDTDNNSADFFLQTVPHPRNSQSPIEPAGVLPPESQGEATTTPSTTEAVPPPKIISAGFPLEITEIMPNPKGPDSGAEWVELYNGSASEFALAGWILDDTGSADVPGESAFVIPAETVIAPFSYLAITIPKGRFVLGNSAGDAIRLFDADKKIKLEQFYPGPAKEGFAYAVDEQNHWSWTETPTPGKRNQITSKSLYPGNLLISEVFPNFQQAVPESQNSFIEIFNPGEDSVDVSEWWLSDGRRHYQISDQEVLETEIPAKGYLVFYAEATGLNINSRGVETVTLLNPVQEQVTQSRFDATGHLAESYALNQMGRYQWTKILTPGKAADFAIGQTPENSQAGPVPATSLGPQSLGSGFISLAEARTQALGSQVQTSGVVAAEPNLLGKNVIYLAGSGIRVQFGSSENLALSLGDEIALTGEMGSFHNETQIKVADASQIVIQRAAQPVIPHEIKTGDLAEPLEGNLVSLTGRVTENSGQTFFVDDGSGPAKIYLMDSTNIRKPKLRQGDFVKITGIVSQYDDTYRILPRYQKDLALADFGSDSGQVQGITTTKKLPRTGLDFWLVLAVFLGFSYIPLVFFCLSKPKSLP